MTNFMQEIKEFKGLDLLPMVASHETPKQNPSHSIGIDLQLTSTINPTAPIKCCTFIGFKQTPSLSIGLWLLGQFALSPLRPLPNSNDTSSQGVHFYEPITKLDLEGVSNVLTCMVGSNIGESKEYSWL